MSVLFNIISMTLLLRCQPSDGPFPPLYSERNELFKGTKIYEETHKGMTPQCAGSGISTWFKFAYISPTIFFQTPHNVPEPPLYRPPCSASESSPRPTG